MTQEETQKALKRLRDKCCNFARNFNDIPIAVMYKDFVVMSIDDIVNEITEGIDTKSPWNEIAANALPVMGKQESEQEQKPLTGRKRGTYNRNGHE